MTEHKVGTREKWLDRAPLGRNLGDPSWFHRYDQCEASYRRGSRTSPKTTLKKPVRDGVVVVALEAFSRYREREEPNG